ncbi:hypothetical protein COU89_01780 [Candidatus Roizmanbacteria bacterium CG10_big_fil_rev_8_21_14_0_10_45_7]|uniref:Uncharacterized protein n=1 Tax=Candidatus Roizmanbacteria bacterium CG10_big_fil_rev_8_21_14_0_10_45_7 TaxID=1974854 RepID=A0A2M8KUW9_9BACT|nr:MAG: hypothetical protein COU89_01780 [Candidatus Roizmanbacteria bacterium CG10_big_fil_rev_8_21_14_0_10_45_7]
MTTYAATRTDRSGPGPSRSTCHAFAPPLSGLEYSPQLAREAVQSVVGNHQLHFQMVENHDLVKHHSRLELPRVTGVASHDRILSKSQETDNIDRPFDAESVVGGHQSLEFGVVSGVVIAHHDYLDVVLGEGSIEDLEKAFTVDIQTLNEQSIGQITIPGSPQLVDADGRGQLTRAQFRGAQAVHVASHIMASGLQLSGELADTIDFTVKDENTRHFRHLLLG